MNEPTDEESLKISKLFYLLAALQILQIAGGLILGLLVAPASLFVSRTESEAFGWLGLGLFALLSILLGIILIALSIIAAAGFRREKKWRKFIGFITIGLAVLEFPLGTILGAFLLRKILNAKNNF